MIDVKELHIGAHASLKGVRVVVFQTLYTGLIEVVKPNKEFELCTTDEIDPIPITPELLAELGFSYHEYDNGNLWEKEFEDIYKGHFFFEYDDCLNVYELSMFCMDRIEVHTYCRYLHELENWVYLVYEKELIKD